MAFLLRASVVLLSTVLPQGLSLTFPAKFHSNNSGADPGDFEHAGLEQVQSALSVEDSMFVERFSGLKDAAVSPQQCKEYMANEGCAWTSEYQCPDQQSLNPGGKSAKHDGSVAYRCCCEVGLWQKKLAAYGPMAVMAAQASKCHSMALANPSMARCEWTLEYPCAEQFRSDIFIADAGDKISDEYTCCCTLGHWRNTVDDNFVKFNNKLDEERKSPMDKWLDKWIWPYFWSDGLESRQLMFVHIPKAAGTAIEDTSETFGTSYPRKWGQFMRGVHMPDGSMCEKYHVPPQYLKALGEPDEDQDVFKRPNTFCVTRHPYERAVSEYFYQLSVQWGPSMSERYRTELLQEDRCTAAGMNHFLFKALTEVKAGRKFLHDCHFVPQTEFIWGNDGTQWCHHKIRFSNLPDAFNDLMEEHGHPARLGNEHQNNSTGVCGTDLSSADLDAATRSLLDEVYESDFRLLDYRMSTTKRS